MAPAQVFTGTELIENREFKETELYHDYARKVGIFHLIGTLFPIGPGEIGALGVHRSQPQTEYSSADKRPIVRFLPHLQRALQLRRRLSQVVNERDVALDALEHTGVATVVVDREGHIVYANSSAETILREGDAVRTIRGRVVANDSAASKKLTRFIREVADTAAERNVFAGGVLAIPRRDRLAVTLLVAPLRAQNKFEGGAPSAILFIRDPERAMASNLALQRLFTLTPAEANIAAALAGGRSVSEIAADNQISLNTMRTHLKHILAKTGTARQAQLVALISHSVATIVPDGRWASQR
jgi:DNA-binding CsgD family transcriptional regulator/PAS domain-containing protein